MRNMKLLESFIILFEVCIAILCNLQQFSLLPGFFLSFSFLDDREKQLFTFRILEWVFCIVSSFLILQMTRLPRWALLPCQPLDWTGCKPSVVKLFCLGISLARQAAGLSAGRSPGGQSSVDNPAAHARKRPRVTGRESTLHGLLLIDTTRCREHVL